MRQLTVPGSPAQGKYSGPGWAEWLLGFFCTILAATQLRAILDSPAQQTALSYYYKEPGIRMFHMAGLAVDWAVVLVVAVWIFFSRFQDRLSLALMVLCIVGFFLGWSELIRAVTPDASRVYQLEGLPFAPVNNSGLLGTSVFFGYFALKLPVGNLNNLAKVLLRLTIWVGLFGVQWMIFEQMVTRWQ